MNWYKRAKILFIKVCQGQAVQDVEHYTDIGHWGENDIYHKKSNYMWVMLGRSIKAVKESDEFPTHGEAFPGVRLERLYSGRYESDTGRVSVIVPREGPYAFRNVPNLLFDLLYKKFPNITQIYQF